jgi:hypothetical protein
MTDLERRRPLKTKLPTNAILLSGMILILMRLFNSLHPLILTGMEFGFGREILQIVFNIIIYTVCLVLLYSDFSRIRLTFRSLLSFALLLGLLAANLALGLYRNLVLPSGTGSLSDVSAYITLFISLGGYLSVMIVILSRRHGKDFPQEKKVPDAAVIFSGLIVIGLVLYSGLIYIVRFNFRIGLNIYIYPVYLETVVALACVILLIQDYRRDTASRLSVISFSAFLGCETLVFIQRLIHELRWKPLAGTDTIPVAHVSFLAQHLVFFVSYASFCILMIALLRRNRTASPDS